MWNTFREELETRVQDELDSMWNRNLEVKSTLRVYRQSKETRLLTTNMYDNSRGSRLLPLARAGTLNTGERRHARDPSADIQYNVLDVPSSQPGLHIEHIVYQEGELSQ